jgi:hypothetical protein
MTEIWPVTVSKDRYNGVYSKALWLAFCLEPCEVPEEPWGDDVTAGVYWREHPYVELIGKGSTMEEAVADLNLKHVEIVHKYHLTQGFCEWCGSWR